MPHGTKSATQFSLKSNLILWAQGDCPLFPFFGSVGPERVQVGQLASAPGAMSKEYSSISQRWPEEVSRQMARLGALSQLVFSTWA